MSGGSTFPQPVSLSVGVSWDDCGKGTLEKPSCGMSRSVRRVWVEVRGASTSGLVRSSVTRGH